MKNTFLPLFITIVLFIFGCTNKKPGEPKVLVFTKTMDYKHASIPKGVAAIYTLGLENNFKVDTTSNSELFTEEILKEYASIIFLNTTGNVLDHKQEAAFERYIQAGGGFVGIHAATDTEYDWNWYGKLVGAYFADHPNGTSEADFVVKDKKSGATNFFTDSIWHRTDELYNFKKINLDVNVILTVDENSYEGGTNGNFHPMSWYHAYDGGRAFYTALGHTDESYTEEMYLKHLLGGIQYAIGENLKLDYGKATSQLPPDVDRFTKKILTMGDFFEPTEMTILPNRDVLIAQRRGELMLYKQDTKEVTQVGFLDVYYKTLKNPDVNAEEGFMGLQKDPGFSTNNWIYIFYSPMGDKWVNRLSRFKFKNNAFEKDSEQVILEVDSQREICCHTGGSIAFGPDGLLYLSTGDNSNPFNEKNEKYVNDGYAPLNDILGHEQYDARRSSSNTNDLRGKILRIKINENGSYEIPKGNLFPKGTEKTRPEIYTMGHRNPYRISVDQKNSYLYWGEVGPDSSEDNFDNRGPKGYDEIGQAREAGNFGWPLFVANNLAYRAYDYETGESGPAFDVEIPINNSRNNTGLTELPKAMPAYIWYPYAASNDFPQLATGGRNAMAGPVYYYDLYEGENKLPDYYNGKLIIYDWMRGWMKAVSQFPNGDFNKMEPFAPEIKLNALIDMEVGPGGRIYLLEYGSGWFTKNDDSALSYIDYNGGNRAPVIGKISVDKNSGKLPLSITASIEANDQEGDAITYVWNLGNGEVKETDAPKIEHIYTEVGDYKISVEVKDSQNATTKSNVISIIAGNIRPEISIAIDNSTFTQGQAINYTVTVKDEDSEGGIDPSNIYVSVDYMQGKDEVSLSLGHQQVSGAVIGKALTLTMDCKACHKEKEASIGPTYMAISGKYKNDKNIIKYLQKKIIEGGSGVWGEVTMPAHSDITLDESREIIVYIRSLSDEASEKKTLPVSGTIVAQPTKGDDLLVLTASYTDVGTDGSKPLTGVKTVKIKKVEP